MYPVSDKFLNAIESNTRKYYYTGTITTVNNVVYEFDNENIVKGSGYITRQCSGSTEIEIGTVYSAEMCITLILDIDRYTLFGAEVRLYFHLVLDDGTVEIIPLGMFEISEANRHIKTLEIKAYDYMLRFDTNLTLDTSTGTAYDLLTLTCSACNVELAQTQAEIDALPNGAETLGIYTSHDMESYRDLLYYVAQVLGCVCQINRDGKLELLQYTTSSIVTIPTEQRFESSYSDFVTRYTSVSSSNLMTEETEYYSLEVDDGLTLELGSNPLLQFGLNTTRERMLNNILDAISVINYTPFDSTVIGNPALDPMDILVFSGGHADESQISCITSITYKIGGRQSLKCVGKNPLLANAKSKTDKEISGLLNSATDSNNLVTHNYMNARAYQVDNNLTEIISIEFTATQETSVLFFAEILLDVSSDKITKTAKSSGGEFEVSWEEDAQTQFQISYYLNSNEVTSYQPKESYFSGSHTMNLYYPITSISASSYNTFRAYIKALGGGKAVIEQAQIRATVIGQGLASAEVEWDGRIEVDEIISRIKLSQVSVVNVKESISTSTQLPISQNVSQSISMQNINVLQVKDMCDTEPVFEFAKNSYELADSFTKPNLNTLKLTKFKDDTIKVSTS